MTKYELIKLLSVVDDEAMIYANGVKINIVEINVKNNEVDLRHAGAAVV